MNNLEQIANWFVIAYISIVGLCIGSFLNVAILRGLSGEDLCFARSKCPSCGNLIKWYMNIPVFSYLFLRGKCAYCKTKISWQYPLVEIIYGCLFLGIYLLFGFCPKTYFLWAFFALFVAMAGTDFKESVIIDIHAYILFALGLVYSFLQIGDVNIIQGLIGAAVGFFLFEAMARIGLLIAGCRMFGEGDSLIALGLGAIFGWKTLLIIFALSVLIQSFSTIPILVIKSFKQKKIKLGVSYILVFIGMALIWAVNQFKLIINDNYYLIFVIVVCAFLIWALKNILFEIKERKLDETRAEEEKFNLMPFGPALILASSLCFFFLQPIKAMILSFLT